MSKLVNFSTKIAQDVLQLCQHHGTIFVLVIELAELNIVMVVSKSLRFLQGLIDELGDLVEFAELLAIVISLAVFHANLLGDVEVEGIEDVHEVVHVQDAFAIPVIDVADFLDFFGGLQKMQ